MLHLGPIWYHSEPSDVPYSQNLPRPISWFGLFLQQNDSNNSFEFYESQPKQQMVYKLRHLYISLIKILMETDENENFSSEIVLPHCELDGKYLSASL